MPTGADLTASWLVAAGARTVFSLSGNQILGLYDALDRHGIRIVHTRHEAGAVHMADAYARLTGQVGVCLVTAAGGHANALGALAMADYAESPILLLSGHAPIARAGQGAFQEMDQAALAHPITRFSAVAERPADIPDLLAAAFHAAQDGRGGPVHLSLPVDVLGTAAEEATSDRLPPHAADDPLLNGEPLTRILDALRAAQRPLILAGPSAARPGLHRPLAELSRLTGVPLLILDHPRGLTDPALGHAGQAVRQADAILLFGKPQDYRLGYAAPPAISAGCHLFQIDPDPDEVGRHRPVEVGLTADLHAALIRLLAVAREHTWQDASTEWSRQIETLRAASLFDPAPTPQNGEPLHPLHIFDALADVIAERGESNLTIVLDGGEFGQWARARLRLRPPHHLLNEPSGTIGFSVPFAIGARAAHPQKLPIAVCGDGAFGFTAMELETAARCGLPILVVVGTDAAWGTERHLQAARYGPDHLIATDLSAARYDLLAQGLGCHGEHVTHFGDLRPALARCLAAVDAGLPALLNAAIASIPSPAGEPPG